MSSIVFEYSIKEFGLLQYFKNLFMTVDDKKIFESICKRSICNGLYAKGNNKVRDHDHVTGKYRDSVHESCNVNLRLTIKIPVIFYNVRGYEVNARNW